MTKFLQMEKALFKEALFLCSAMKRFFIFILLLTTALYILPVKDFLQQKDTYSFVGLEDSKEETVKKEKTKDLCHIPATVSLVRCAISGIQASFDSPTPVLFHPTETPPPDVA